MLGALQMLSHVCALEEMAVAARLLEDPTDTAKDESHAKQPFILQDYAEQSYVG